MLHSLLVIQLLHTSHLLKNHTPRIIVGALFEVLLMYADITIRDR